MTAPLVLAAKAAYTAWNDNRSPRGPTWDEMTAVEVGLFIAAFAVGVSTLKHAEEGQRPTKESAYRRHIIHTSRPTP